MADETWAVSVPGLTEGQATELLHFAEEKKYGSFGVGDLTDPSFWYARQLDRATVEGLVRVLEIGLQSGVLPPTDHTYVIADSMVDDMREWLEDAAPALPYD